MLSDPPELACIVCERHISTNTLYCDAHDVADPGRTDGSDASHPDRA